MSGPRNGRARTQGVPVREKEPGRTRPCGHERMEDGTRAAGQPTERKGADGAHMELTVENVTMSLGAGAQRRRVLDDVSFRVPEGTFTSLLGASGAGKSTLLKVCLLYTSRCV